MMTALGKWKLSLSLAGIFAAGSVTGWMVASKNARQAAFKPPEQNEIAGSWKHCLQSKLSLTPGQKKKVDAILDRNSGELQALHGENLKRIRQSLSNRNSQIAAVLTPDQQRVFVQLEKERRESRGKDYSRNKSRNQSKSEGDKSQRSDRSKKERGTNSSAVSEPANCPPENRAAFAP